MRGKSESETQPASKKLLRADLVLLRECSKGGGGSLAGPKVCAMKRRLGDIKLPERDKRAKEGSVRERKPAEAPG